MGTNNSSPIQKSNANNDPRVKSTRFRGDDYSPIRAIRSIDVEGIRACPYYPRRLRSDVDPRK